MAKTSTTEVRTEAVDSAAPQKKSFAPFVYWAQRDDRILLKVALKNLKDPEITVKDNSLKFAATAEGQNGLNFYSFELDLYASLENQNWHSKERETFLDFALIKSTIEWWPKLLQSGRSPPWLKIDFDRWQDPAEDELDENMNEIDVQREADREMFRRFAADTRNKEASSIYSSDEDESENELKVMILFFYNLLQLTLMGFILCLASWRAASSRDHSFFTNVFSMFHVPLIISTAFTFTEVLFGAIGWTSGGKLNPLMQCSGRSIALLVVSYADQEAQQKLAFLHLLLTWAIADVIRFAYLMCNAIGQHFPYLQWVRYTMWLPLYPLGFGLEVVNMVNCLPHYTRKAAEQGIPYPYLIYTYLPIAGFGFLKLYMHMFKVRRRKLGRNVSWTSSKSSQAKSVKDARKDKVREANEKDKKSAVNPKNEAKKDGSESKKVTFSEDAKKVR